MTTNAPGKYPSRMYRGISLDAIDKKFREILRCQLRVFTPAECAAYQRELGPRYREGYQRVLRPFHE